MPEQAQQVVRIHRTVDDHLALVHHLAVVHQEVLVLGDQVLVLLLVEVGDHQALLALGVLAEAHRAGDFRQHARVLRRARLEELATRGRPPVMSRVFETSCGMRASTSPTCTCWPSRTAITAPTGKLMFTAWSVPAMRTSSPASLMSLTEGRWPCSRPWCALVDHHEGREAGDVVDLLGDGGAFLDVLELHRAGVLGDDRPVVRVPGRELLARAHLSPSAACSARRTAPCGARARGRCRR